MKINLHSRFNKGFTLIELLVVIAIIGILSSIVLAALESARSRARDTRRKSDFQAIQAALELYYLDHGQYPSPENYSIYSNICASDWPCWREGGSFYNALSPYINGLPQDPRFNARIGPAYGTWFAYAYESLSPDSFCLVGTLENQGDSMVSAQGDNCHNNAWWPNFSIER